MQAFASRNTWEWLGACNSSKLSLREITREWKLEIRSSIHRSPLSVYIVSRFHVDQTFSSQTITRLPSWAQHFRKVSRYIKIGHPSPISLRHSSSYRAISLSFHVYPFLLRIAKARFEDSRSDSRHNKINFISLGSAERDSYRDMTSRLL